MKKPIYHNSISFLKKKSFTFFFSFYLFFFIHIKRRNGKKKKENDCSASFLFFLAKQRIKEARKKNLHSVFNITSCPAKPYMFIQFKSKSELLSIIHGSSNMLNIFKAKLKKNSIDKAERVNKNYAGKTKHYPPANKEWFNSVYAYNNNTIKLLPAADKTILRLVKSYFNFYSRKLEKKVKSRRLRIRARRLSTNRILVSRAELKHTNDKVIVTIYVYNRQKKYYLNKINKIATIDNIDNLLPEYIKKTIKKSNGPWPSSSIVETVRNKSLYLRSKVKMQKNVFLETLNMKNKTDSSKLENYEKKYLKYYIIKSLRKEILSVYFRQLISFNKSKFQKRYLLPLTKLAMRVYNKQVEFNLVNLKYLYLNSYIFSDTLVTKLRNRKNRILTVLDASLLMSKVPPLDRLAVFDEIYNRKKIKQNMKIENLVTKTLDFKSNPLVKNNDMLDQALLKVDLDDSLSMLNNFQLHRRENTMYFNFPSYVSDAVSKWYFNYPLHITNTIINSIKHKFLSGVRLEVAGRLTKRNTAARSVFKLRYKGNIKNEDSSHKGLSTVLLRGHAKSNLQYTKLKSKIRIGSFGLKGWLSSS